MRLNLVEEIDHASSDAFLRAYRSAGGDPDDRHPFWDLLDAADFLLDSSNGTVLQEHDPGPFEALVAEALAEL
jgi:hypothetical protein